MLEKKNKVVIESIGGYLPEKIFSNNYLKNIYGDRFDEGDSWISTRHITGDNEILADISIKAAKKCLSSNDIQDVQCVILASMTPDNRGIATAPVIAHKLNLNYVPAYDVRAGETGGLCALQNAVGLLSSGQYNKILVIAADINSKYINYESNSKDAQLYGDGAVAVVLSNNSNKGIAEYQTSHFGAFEEYYYAKILPVGGCEDYYRTTRGSIKQRDLSWNIDHSLLEKFADNILTYVFAHNLCFSRSSDRYILQTTKCDILKKVLAKHNISNDKFVDYHNNSGDIGTGTTYLGLLYIIQNKLMVTNECLSMISYGTGGNFGIINWIWKNEEEIIK